MSIRTLSSSPPVLTLEPVTWRSKERWINVLILTFSVMCLVGIIPSVQDILAKDAGNWNGIPNVDLAWAGIVFSLIGIAFGVSAGKNIAYSGHDKQVLLGTHRTGRPTLLQKGLRFFIGLPLALLGISLFIQAVFKEAILDVVSVAVKGGTGTWTTFIIIGTVGGILLTIPWEMYYRERANRFHPNECITKWGKRFEYAQGLAHSVVDLPFVAVQKVTATTKAVASGSVQVAGRIPGDASRLASQLVSRIPFPQKGQSGPLNPSEARSSEPTAPPPQVSTSLPPPAAPNSPNGTSGVVRSVSDMPFEAIHKANETARSGVAASISTAARVTNHLKRVSSGLPVPFGGSNTRPVQPTPPVGLNPSREVVYCSACGAGNGQGNALCERCRGPLLTSRPRL